MNAISQENTQGRMKAVFQELCKGNINAAYEPDILAYINQFVMYLMGLPATKIRKLTVEDIDELKHLIMVSNILYNRSDINVLPVEDGVYDKLLELYRKFDPNFQVGSEVVQLQSIAEERLERNGEQKAIEVLHFLPEVNRDDMRQHFYEQLTRFDGAGRFKPVDVFSPESEVPFMEGYISKRTHDTKHHHPDLVGTLDKCKFVLDHDAIEMDAYNDPNVTILERDFFVKHIRQGIIQPDQELELILELKYDGISVEADCSGVVESARTRGDTGIGEASDITPILQGYRFPRYDMDGKPIGVKFEAIITNTDLQTFNKMKWYEYANCRTAIIGLFGSSDAYKYRDLITLIPLAVDRNDVPWIRNRMEEIELINREFQKNGEPLRYCYIKGDYKTCLYLIKKFAEEAEYARNYLNFMFDGIVVSYLDEDIRKKLGRENYINKYQMAVKFNPLTKLTTFLGYSYTVGMTGNICPMIHYTPVDFFGTVHNKSSGSSFNRFMKLSLKPGEIIKVTYNNDVMPYVAKYDCEENRKNKNEPIPFTTKCPSCGSDLVMSKTGTQVFCENPECPGRMVRRMANLVDKIGISGFGEHKLEQLGIYSFSELMDITPEQTANLGKADASAILESVSKLKMTPIEDYRYLGALGFTSLGANTWKLIFSKYTLREFVDMIENNTDTLALELSMIRGIGSSTVSVIIKEYPYFREDIQKMINECTIIDTKFRTFGKSIRFTGCRNMNLESELCKLGHDASGSAAVTKKTDILLVPYAGFHSTKVDKASETCMIIPIDEFIHNMDKYL